MDPNQPTDSNNPTPLNPLPVQPVPEGATIDSTTAAPVTIGNQMPPVMPQMQSQPISPFPAQPEISQPQFQDNTTPPNGGGSKKKLSRRKNQLL